MSALEVIAGIIQALRLRVEEWSGVAMLDGSITLREVAHRTPTLAIACSPDPAADFG